MSMGTINTMDLMGAVQNAIEEEEQNRSMDTDASSVIPLQDLLRREPLTPLSASSKKKKSKRKSRSPASGGESPSRRKLRVKSPSASSVSSEVASSFCSPEASVSTPVGLKDIDSVVRGALVGESVILRSCLSARKQRRGDASVNRSVVFGSPNVAEFRKHSPTTSFTPMDKREAKMLFSMEPAGGLGGGGEVAADAVDDVTAENERILEEWDRLTNASEGNVSDEEESPGRMDTSTVSGVDKENLDLSSSSLNKSNLNRNRRRLSKLQPLIELEAEDNSTYSSNASRSVAEDISGISHTVQLPDTMADLIAQNDVSCSVGSSSSRRSRLDVSSFSQEPSRTVDIETDLHELMNNIEGGHPMRDESNLSHEPSRTVEIETDLRELMKNVGGWPDPQDQSLALSDASSYNPLASTMHVGSFVSDQDDDSRSGRMPLITSSLVPARLSVSSVASSNDSRSSAGIMQSIFGDKEPISKYTASNLPQTPEDHGAMDVDDEIALSMRSDELETSASHRVSDDDMVSRMSDSFTPQSAQSSKRSLSILGESDVSSNASTVEDNESRFIAQPEMSFIDAKKRIVFGNTSHLSAQDVSHSAMSMSAPAVNEAATNALLQRLQALKDGARQQTLSQCRTPGVPNKRQSLEFQRLSLAAHHQQLLLSAAKPAARPSIMPSPIAANRSILLASSILDASVLGEHDAVNEASTSLLRQSIGVLDRSSLHHESQLSHYRESEEIIENLEKFFRVVQNINTCIATVDESLQEVVQRIAEETFASAIKGLVLGFEHLDADLVFSAWSWDASDAVGFVQTICDELQSHPAPFSEEIATMALLGCSGWEVMWTNLVATAIFELSEALQQYQLTLRTKQRSRQNDIFDAFGRNRFLDKVLDKPRRQSLTIADLTRESGPLTGHFSRFYAVEEYMQSVTQEDPAQWVKDAPEPTKPDQDATLQQEAMRLDLLNQILNRMTFVQVQEIFEDHIGLVIHLTDSVQLSLDFHLADSESTGALEVDFVETKLVIGNATKASKSANESTSSFEEGQYDEEDDQRIATAQENAITLAYYGEFMTASDGVLGERTLSNLVNVADVPALLSNVVSQVTVLRKVLQFVRALHLTGGLSMVTKQNNGNFSLNMDHIDLTDPISVELRVLVCTIQMNNVFKMINEDKAEPGVVRVMRVLETAQKSM
eukprot:gene6952-5012_t